MTEQAVAAKVQAGLELAKRVVEDASPLASYSTERLALIARTVAPGATADELTLFISFCEARGLNPMLKQVYFMKDKDGRVSIITGIDGLRLTAQRSTEYQGQEGPFWKAAADSEWSDTPPVKPPFAAKVGVWRKGFRSPIWATVKLSSFTRSGENWTKRPEHQLAIRAESHALKRAFPAETAGLTVRYDEGGAPVEGVNFSGDPDAPVTYPQLKPLHALSKEHGWDREQRLAAASEHLGRTIRSFSGLTRGEASELIATWSEDPRAGSVEADASASLSADEQPTTARAPVAPGPDQLEHPPAPPTGRPNVESDSDTTHPEPAEHTDSRNVQGKGGRSSMGKGASATRPADPSEAPIEDAAGVDQPSASGPSVTGRSTRAGDSSTPTENADSPAATAPATPGAPTHPFEGSEMFCARDGCGFAEENDVHGRAK